MPLVQTPGLSAPGPFFGGVMQVPFVMDGYWPIICVVVCWFIDWRCVAIMLLHGIAPWAEDTYV